MKAFFPVLFLLLIGVEGAAQEKTKKDEEVRVGVITGKVSDSASRVPLEYATISLYAAGGRDAVDGTTTNNSGHFQLLNVGAGSYTVVIESIGYEPSRISSVVINEKNKVSDLKNILLSKKIKSMREVVVTSQARIIENKIDKLVFNAEKDLTSQTGVATDVLKKVPQVSVDIDGNVELAGSTSVRFLINGKPSSAFGSNIADVLQSIPASQIKSIEVITNPGAKYDAEGIGGIINIILKKSSAQGINGNLSLTGGTRMDNGSFNFNARKGKLAFNAFFGGNFRPYAKTPMEYSRSSSDSSGHDILLEQDGFSKFRRGGFHSGISVDYTLDEKNSLSASLGYSHFGNSGMGSIDQSFLELEPSTGIVDSSQASVNNTASSFKFYEKDASINYKKNFTKEDQELEIAADISLGSYRSTNSDLQYLAAQSIPFYGTNASNPGKENEAEATIDYTQPMKKEVKLGVGGKAYFRDITSEANVFSYQPSSLLFLPDSSLSNSLVYHEQVWAVYSELTFPVGKLFDAKIGGRYERTDIQSDFSNVAQKVNIPGYNTFVPSIFLSKKLGENQQLKLSYSKRIERPEFRDLDPFINTTDSRNISSGNPYLQPEIGNRYELGYNIDLEKTGSLVISALYRTSNHDIQSYLVYYPSLKIGDSLYTNVSVSTRENIGLERDAGISLFANIRVFTKLTLRTNFFAFRRHTLNAIDAGFDAHSVNFRTNMNASYEFTNTFSAEFFGNFNSARHEVQGIYPSFTSYSLAARKQFWKRNGSLAITAVNPFNKYVKQETILHGPGFNVRSIRRVPFRSFGLNFTWKFGKLEFKKERDENSPNLNPPAE